MTHSTKKTKSFDCIAFKREVQKRWREETREMPAEERREHSQRVIESSPLAAFWRRVTEQAKIAPKRGRL